MKKTLRTLILPLLLVVAVGAQAAVIDDQQFDDRIRLADTDLLIEVTDDLCGGPGRAGEEAVFAQIMATRKPAERFGMQNSRSAKLMGVGGIPKPSVSA